MVKRTCPSRPLKRVPRQRRRRFYVDIRMCGGESFLEDFDLAEFCAILQEVVPRVEVIPLTKASQHAHNSTPPVVSEAEFVEAINRYSRR